VTKQSQPGRTGPPVSASYGRNPKVAVGAGAPTSGAAGALLFHAFDYCLRDNRRGTPAADRAPRGFAHAV